MLGRAELTPVGALVRAETAFGERTAVVDGERRVSYRAMAERARRFAGLLRSLDVEAGDRVSVLSPNTAAMLVSHFAIPMAGAVINALNPRLSPGELARIVEHAGSRVIVADRSVGDRAAEVASLVPQPITIVTTGLGSDFQARLDAAPEFSTDVTNEDALLALNYTSGTTGRPKGVMYGHRGAFLQATAMIAHSQLDSTSVFLWTLPMFHCNGWCFPWAVTAAGATHVMLDRPDADLIWSAIGEHRVTHFNAAPTVLSRLVDAPAARRLEHRVRIATGGAPPAPTLIARLGELGIEVTHLYGLTETYGPAVICDRGDLDGLDDEHRARLLARQGVANVVGPPVRVVDDRGHDVPTDGATAGEVLVGGNTVMLGYYRDPDATAAATFDSRWLRTGDIGVLHPDGHLQLVDRAKDIIISGGENIASVEVEQALLSHDAVAEAAVVGRAHAEWGEVPVAYVELRPGRDANAEELIAHVKATLASFKAPKRIEFVELPRTATGKIRKVELRQRAGRTLADDSTPAAASAGAS